MFQTTRLYRVPSDNKINQQRQELLHKAYFEAKEKAEKRIKELKL